MKTSVRTATILAEIGTMFSQIEKPSVYRTAVAPICSTPQCSSPGHQTHVITYSTVVDAAPINNLRNTQPITGHPDVRRLVQAYLFDMFNDLM
jgi:hypothetical protein